MLKYRLRSLLIMIFLAAVLMAWLSVHLRERYEDQVQRSSFSTLTEKANSFNLEWRDRLQVLKGLDFDTNHFGGHVATDFVTPYFHHKIVYKSSNGDISQWKTLVRMRSQMSSYPESHKLLIEYQAQDMNQYLLATVKEHFKGEDAIIILKEIPAGDTVNGSK